MEKIELYSKPLSEADYDISLLKRNLKEIMWDYVGIIRDEVGLNNAKSELLRLSKEFKRNRKCEKRKCY